MMKLKKILLLGIVIGICVFTAGCNQKETVVEAVTETSAEEVEKVPQLHPLVVEPVPESVEVELPRSYNYIEENCMPLLKNQGNTNTCWAFASLSALESSKDEDVKGSFSADQLIFHNPFENQFTSGGSYVVTMAYLLSWRGPVMEENDPFDGKSDVRLAPCLHVQEVRESAPKDYEAIKRFVYLYGGVESALYVDFDATLLESSYYNKECNSFCYSGEEISNHDVLIVGWDDDYPAGNFIGEVASDGAFLCQNSWGESFGDQGTFWVSYEDVNIGGYGVVYSRIDTVDNYDLIYQSDLCGFTAQIGYEQEECWFANVYTPEDDIFLKAAGFYVTGKNTEYELYVVPRFKNEDSFQLKQYVCKGFLEDAGYYTIDFPEAVEIQEGNDFAIVVKIKTEGAEYPVAIEYPVEDLSEHADMSDGRGYLSFQGTSWEHIEETKDYNICLKGYADL